VSGKSKALTFSFRTSLDGIGDGESETAPFSCDSGFAEEVEWRQLSGDRVDSNIGAHYSFSAGLDGSPNNYAAFNICL